MPQINPDGPVGELVALHPELSRVFEELQIDYCCHGATTLREACHQRQLDPDEVIAKIASQPSLTTDHGGVDRDWTTAPLGELCDHIEQTHHAFLREELPRLESLIKTVADAHGGQHPELQGVRDVFQTLQAELMPHMMKEEQILFPAIRQLEAADHAIELPFGTVQNPIRMMEHEHDVAGSALGQLRNLTNDYQPPPDACSKYHAMVDGLQSLELDLHQHIHKENNILFPRSQSREQQLG